MELLALRCFSPLLTFGLLPLILAPLYLDLGRGDDGAEQVAIFWKGVEPGTSMGGSADFVLRYHHATRRQ
jgi:hypothetical protein